MNIRVVVMAQRCTFARQLHDAMRACESLHHAAGLRLGTAAPALTLPDGKHGETFFSSWGQA